MRIIEGTPQEVNEYLNKSGKSSYSVTISPDAFDTKANDYIDEKKQQDKAKNIKAYWHWSQTKSKYVAIEDMDKHHVANVVRQKLYSNNTKQVLEDSEFQSLIVNLADKIVADL